MVGVCFWVSYMVLLFSSMSLAKSKCPKGCRCLDTYVDCDLSGFKTIPKNIPQWAVHLEINRNNFSQIEALTFQNLKHLRILMLKRNEIDTLKDGAFYGLEKIEKLMLDNNCVTLITKGWLYGLESLRELSLRHNRISQIHDDAWEFCSNLTVLDLSYNKLDSIKEDTFKNLNNLQKLLLSDNNIAVIKDRSFVHLPKLKIFEINRNKFSQIEALTFQNLKHLRTLMLKRNEIVTLKDGAFYGLEKIEKLMLDNNYVTLITKGWLYGLEFLKELSLRHNRINQIHDDAWEFCSNVTVLDLSYNKLDSIKEDSFKNLNNLQKLLLSNNNIAIIKDTSFVHLPKLKVLHFNHNKISWTIEDAKGVFQGLGDLEKFHLVGNNIRLINSDAFLGLRNVFYINLADNNITSVHNNSFSKVPALKQLVINSNSMLCDCNLKWFLDWLSVKKLEVQASCVYPQWLHGQSLTNISVSNLTCDESPIPRLIEEPDVEIMALKEKYVTLSCKAASSLSSNMTIVWRKDNVELVNSNIIVRTNTDPDSKSVETVSELKLLSVEHSHAGKYQCVVSNSYGVTYSQKSIISVLVYPTFLKKPKNVEVVSGKTVKLECAASGEPPPEIAWHKDGGNDFPAARERRMHFLHGDDVFFIVNVHPRDAGVYSCTAHNAAGTASADAHLEVLQRPQLASGPEDRELTAGEPIVLQCMAQGVPKPTVTWFKDGELIVPTERHFFIVENQLVIIVDSVHNDTGTYECHLNNSQGEEIGRSRIVIKSSETYYNTSNMMGIIIITVVCCAVLTSIVWVAIIYQTRKSTAVISSAAFPDTELTEMPADCASERSSCKDSGTGDSARRSSDDLAEISVLLHCPRSDHDRVHQGESVEVGD